MAENDVSIQINVETKEAQDAIEAFGRESAKALKNTNKAADDFFSSFAKSGDGIRSVFDNIKDSFLPITGIFVGVQAAVGTVTAAFGQLSKAIEEASADARLTRQIESSLRATDEASASAVEGVLEFADAIKDATGVSDDLVKQTFITAASFGVGADRAKELTQAAIDLAAATGIDVETAVRQLGGTLDGSVGKIGNLGAEFRNLTKDQLEAGAAIDLVNSKFGGAAEKELNTYQGSVNKLGNAWGDFLKEIGKTATESTIAQQSLSGLASIIDDITDKIQKFRQGDLEITGADVVRGTGSIEDLRLLNKELAALQDIEVGAQSKQIAEGFAGIIEQAQGASRETGNFLDRLNQFPQSEGPKSIGLTGKALEDAKKKAKELNDEFQKFKGGLLTGRGTEIEREVQKAQTELLKLADFERKLGPSVSKEVADLKLRIATDLNATISKINADQAEADAKSATEAAQRAAAEQEKIFKERQERIQTALSKPFTFAFDSSRTSPFSEEEVAAGITGGITTALQGRSGAVKAVSQVADTIGAAFGIPGVGGLAELLSRGPEATKQFIREFIASIPDIIQAISESIPVVVEALVDALINKGGALKIGIAIAKAMVLQPVWGKLSEQIFGKSGEELGQAITEGVNEYASNTQDAFTQFFTNIGPAFGKLFENFGRDIDESLNSFDDKFSEGLTDFFDGFGEALNDWLNAVGPAFSQFFDQIGPALEQAFDGLITGIVDGISNVFMPIEDALNSLGDTINAFADAISPNNIGGKGGGKGLIAETFGFSKGGLVYAQNGFFEPKGTDTVPAMLTPGELVVPRDMVGELGAFLMAQKSDAGGNDTAILAAIYSAVQAPLVVKTEAKVNQSVFADIILQLNRQNARLTA